MPRCLDAGFRALLAGVLVLSALCAGGPSRAADATAFESIGDIEQVPDGVITALAEDAQGLLWIGTTDGLIRYDGYRFRRYANDPVRSDSLPGNRIQTLMLASDGRLWVGTYSNGVAIYDPRYDGFRALAPTGAADPGRPPRTVRAMAETPDGCVWIGTTGAGLERICGDGELKPHNVAGGEALQDDRISALAVDATGSLWIGSWRGISRLRAGGEQFQSVLSDPGDPEGFAGTTIRGFHVTEGGDLWVGSQQGLMARLPAAVLDREEPPKPSEVQRFRGEGLNAAIEPGDGSLWIGHGSGIDVYALDGSALLERIRHRAVDPLSLANAEIRALIRDRAGWVWSGSFGGGLQRTSPRQGALQARRFDPIADAPLNQFSALTLASARDGGLWAGVARNGVVRLDASLRLVELLAPGTLAEGDFEGQQPSGLVETEDGSLWVATERGLFRRRADSGRFELGAGADFLEGSSVRRLWSEADGRLWIATGDGLFVREPGGRLWRLPGGGGEPVRGSINALILSPDGGWVGGNSGLFRLDAAHAQLIPQQRVVNGEPIRSDVLGLLVDSSGQLWMDAGGLYRLLGADGDVLQFEAISARHGFADVSFGANLMEDAEGRIWTHRFVYDPRLEAFHRLGRADGALSGTGWFRSFARLADGRMVFGATEGLLAIRPERFEPWRYEPPLVFTDLRVNGESRPFGVRAEQLVLAPGERGFALEFAALDLSAPELLRYRYRLLGLDDAWVEVDASARVASFGGLWPGEYRLQVEGSNRSGHFSPHRLELIVQVLPHWWQTPWAMLLGLALLGGLVAMLVRWRERRLRRSKQRLEAEVAARTADLTALSSELASKNLDFEQASLTDPLTGLRNRRFAMQEMPKEVALCLRRHESRVALDAEAADLVLFMIDLDHFKSVNDNHGHAAGDAVLCQFAERLREVFRASDHLVRWGGEEFLVVARDTHREGAAELAERLRRNLAEQAFQLDDGTRISRTVCIGFAPFPLTPAQPQACSWEDVVDLADQLLYACKRGGRDAWIGLFPESVDPGLLACGDWSDPARVRAGQARLCSSLPEARALAAMGEQMQAIALGV